MGLKPKFEYLLAALISLGMTSGAYFWNLKTVQKRVEAQALSWARQITKQAEGLVFYAQEIQEKNPSDLAAQILSLGDESKLVDIRVFNSNQNESTPEKYELNSKKNEFTYIHFYAPETGKGFQVLIRTRYLGFLGTTQRLTNDSFLVLFFLLLNFLTLKLLQVRRLLKMNQQSQNLLSEWCTEAKSELKLLSLSLKGLIQISQKLILLSKTTKGEFDFILNQSADLDSVLERLKVLANKDPKGLSGIREMEITLQKFSQFLQQEKIKNTQFEVNELVRVLDQRMNETRTSILNQDQNLQNLKKQLTPRSDKPQ